LLFLSPGVPLVLSGKRPDVEADQGDSLGARLRRRRRELGLRQDEAAKLLGVDPKSVMWWERDERPPIVSAYPAIISFLGSEPWPEPQTLGEALLAERRRRGIEIRKAAALAGVDEGTWRRWERGEWKATPRTVPAISLFLGYPAGATFPGAVRCGGGPRKWVG
jgi:transcriptional regulator with XRE-family HTH domain